jgi:hypothetical protein
MESYQHKLKMYDFIVYRIYIQGALDDSWSDYFETRDITVEMDEHGNPVTVLTTGAMDQSALVGLINRLSSLGLPLIALEYLCEESNS